jgi:glycosyltransferase involved in cell wall biosynthesis
VRTRPALVVRGPFRGYSGHDRHTRAFARHLVAAGVRVQLVDLPEWSPLRLPSRALDAWFERQSRAVTASAVLHFCMPHQVRADPSRLNVNYTMFEGSRIPASWAAASRTHDLVIVPTASSRAAWLAAGVPARRVAVSPLGVDADAFRPGVRALAIADGRGGDVSRYRARFLNVSASGARKNVGGLVRAWLRATRHDDDAVLVLKRSYGAGETIVALMAEIARAERDVGRTLASSAAMVVEGRALPDAAMPALFAAATHYVSLSRGEGWDQPMCEAGASGLAVIAPRHTAYRAYLDDRVAWLLPARRVPAAVGARDPTGTLFAGVDWWEPDEDAAVAAIRRAIDHPERRKSGLRRRLVTRFSWTRATRRLLGLLRGLHRERGLRFDVA